MAISVVDPISASEPAIGLRLSGRGRRGVRKPVT